MMNNWHKKEKPHLSSIGLGGGIGRNLVRSAVEKATGGTVFADGAYTFHVFISPGTLTTIEDNITVQYLVVGGGGAGAQYNGGGGGAGGVRTGSGLDLGSASGISITVGDGGTQAPTGVASNGSPSSLGSFITSAGGGKGGGSKTPGLDNPGNNGGSGGGGGSYGSNGSSGSGNIPPVSPSQGNPGSSALPYTHPQAGGGGGGGAGGSGGTGNNKQGGNGVPISWMPSSYGTPGPSPGRWFGGGGSGGTGNTSLGVSDIIAGGAGGGGYGNTAAYGNYAPVGGPSFGLMPTSATLLGENTGGGGGGANGNGDPSPNRGQGAKGIVVIRYPT